MIYLLDTNACIRYMNGRSARLRDELHRRVPADIVVCSVVKAELFYGAMRSHDPARSLGAQERFLAPYVSLPFDDAAAKTYAMIRADLERVGTPIGGNDMQIAAIALTHHLTVVTHNVAEFRRVSGLSVEDWETGTP